jgi:predicted SprT family Zn-dependent metalloprotease
MADLDTLTGLAHSASVRNPKNAPCLETLYEKLNQQHFGGILGKPKLKWNSRLRSSAGRFAPMPRRVFLNRLIAHRDPTIEIASYLLDHPDSPHHITDTLAHEMIHYWLWDRGRPFGHTEEFHRKLKEIGATRYNLAPKFIPHKYEYRCPNCDYVYRAKKRLGGNRACKACCRAHGNGRYDPRFQIYVHRTLTTAERRELTRLNRSIKTESCREP